MGDMEPRTVDINGILPFAIMNCRTKAELATRISGLAASFIVFGFMASLVPDQAVLAATYCPREYRFIDPEPDEWIEDIVTHHQDDDGTITDIYTSIVHSNSRPDHIISVGVPHPLQ